MRTIAHALKAALQLAGDTLPRVSLSAGRRVAPLRARLEPDPLVAPEERKAWFQSRALRLAEEPWIVRAVAIYPHLFFEVDLDAFSRFLEEDLEVPADEPACGPLSNVSYCSPNANKPLHLGHARNLAIGGCVSNLLRATGHRVVRSTVYSDYGVHVARAVAAWLEEGGEATPESTGTKGDHLVGRYYTQGVRLCDGEGTAEFTLRVQRLLQAYVAGDPEARKAFRTLTGWAIAGFEATLRRFGSRFDRNFRESDSLAICNRIVEQGLERRALERQTDGSVWAVLDREEGDQILLRADGTPLYLLQAIANSLVRQEALGPQLGLYLSVRANEQSSHFSAYLATMRALDYRFVCQREALLYGLVYRGKERMRSRTGSALPLDATLDELERQIAPIAASEQPRDLRSPLAVGMLRTYLLAHALPKPVHFDWQDLTQGRGRLYLHVHQLLLRSRAVACGGAPTHPARQVRQALLEQIARYREVVERCARRREPRDLVTYLNDLCDAGYAYLGRSGPPTGRPAEARMLARVLDRLLELLELPTSTELGCEIDGCEDGPPARP